MPWRPNWRDILSTVWCDFQVSPTLDDPMKEALEQGVIEPFIEIGYRLTAKGREIIGLASREES